MTGDTKRLLSAYVRRFNENDEELARHCVPDSAAEDWMLENCPRIAVPDSAIEQTYYFRWWTYRKHIRNTPDGRIVTEFLPDVPWASDCNAIPCAAAHHIREGRWLKDSSFLDEYIRFWLKRPLDQLHSYSNWFESSVESLAKVRGDETGPDIADDLVRSLQKWYDDRMTASGLLWSNDDRDGSEYSISGPGLRPTLNSYIYAGNLSVAAMLDRKGDPGRADMLRMRAEELRSAMEQLWDEEKRFYITIPQKSVSAVPYRTEQRRARELFGYLPWMFGAAAPGRADAFRQLLDENGFKGKAAASFAERRHPGYGIFYTGGELNRWLASRGDPPAGEEGHECLWNGPSWPYATSLALTALAELLSGGEKQDAVTPGDYSDLLHRYAASHVIRLEDGRVLPWIDENMDPDTGVWIARTRLRDWNGECFPAYKGGYERGKDYNHSVFCDCVLEGLFGIRPEWDALTVAPLFPASWDYARAEEVSVHGKSLTIRYEKESGYEVLLDGVVKFRSEKPEPCRIGYT